MGNAKMVAPKRWSRNGAAEMSCSVPPLCINSRNIERVMTFMTFKLLGVVISSDLTCDAHVSYIQSECAKRIYCIWNLSKAGVLACDIFIVQLSDLFWSMHVMFGVLDCLTLSKYIERVQKHCLKIIYPKLSYSEALEKSGLVLLDTRREEITQCTFRQVKCPTHPLHCSITCKVFTSQMRPTYPFQLQSVKKSRCGRYLIPYCIAKKY